MQRFTFVNYAEAGEQWAPDIAVTPGPTKFNIGGTSYPASIVSGRALDGERLEITIEVADDVPLPRAEPVGSFRG